MTESNGEAILSNNPTPHIYTRQSIGSKLKAHHLTHADQSSVRRRWSIWPRRTGGAKSYTQSSENAKNMTLLEGSTREWTGCKESRTTTQRKDLAKTL